MGFQNNLRQEFVVDVVVDVLVDVVVAVVVVVVSAMGVDVPHDTTHCKILNKHAAI